MFLICTTAVDAGGATVIPDRLRATGRTVVLVPADAPLAMARYVF
jgi:hypothetical protein